MVPSAIIPRTPEEVAQFAQNERYLLTAIIIVASRNQLHMRDVHDKSWAVFRVCEIQVQADSRAGYRTSKVWALRQLLAW